MSKPPPYYDLNPEPIEVIERIGMGFHAANTFKYLARLGRKGPPAADAAKALDYASRLEANLRKENSVGLELYREVRDNWDIDEEAKQVILRLIRFTCPDMDEYAAIMRHLRHLCHRFDE